VIRTDRQAQDRRRGRLVDLTPAGESDASEFLAGVRASRALHRGWVTPPVDRPAYARYVQRSQRDDFEGFLVRRRDDAALVGAANLSQIFRDGFQSAYLGFYVFAPFGGRGYMTEAVRLVLGIAFRSLRLHRVEANVQPENVYSRALVESIGFRREGYSPRYLKISGRWRDHERWAVLADERRAIRRGDRGSY
jgi:[ribosomal protein S5]-alanine N-acetyltransferase